MVKPPTPAFRIESWLRYTLYLCTLGLYLSALIWLGLVYFARVQQEWGALPHPAEHGCMQAHALFVWPFVWIVGSFFFPHIRRAHRAQINRLSAWVLLILLLWLCVSAYVLAYWSGEQSRAIWSLLHWMSGLSLPLILFWHIWLGRKILRHHNHST